MTAPNDLPAGPELDAAAIQHLRQIERWQNATDESREGEDRDADYLLATQGIDWLKEMLAAERAARQAAERERDELQQMVDTLLPKNGQGLLRGIMGLPEK